MNLANAITVARILFIPVFMVFLLVRVPQGEWIAAAVFCLAASTDAVDGWIARSTNQVTKIGKLLDPIADKLLISAALITLVSVKPDWALNPGVATLIISREFAVSGLRMVAIAEGKVIAASKWGKAKTITQVVAIVLWMLRPRFAEFPGPIGVWEAAAWGLMGVAVVVTLVSGIDYFVKARDVLVISNGTEAGPSS